MKCHEAKKLLDAYSDRELSGQDHDLVKLHLDQCTSCPNHLAEIEMTRSWLRVLPQFTLPEGLTTRIDGMLEVGEGQDIRQRREWTKVPAVTHLAAACLGALMFYGLTNLPLLTEPMDQIIVASHLRSLEGVELIQIASADTHTVGPWFAGKVSFSPLVTELSEQGFPLLGGRVDELEGEKVAVIVYGRRAHKINLYITPSSANLTYTPKQLTRRGYNLIGWSQDDFDYWAVSDLTMDELVGFSELIKAGS